jgi:hypothetical protein
VVAVAHPDLFAGLWAILWREPACEEGVGESGGGDKGAAEFGGAMAAFYFAAQAVHHDLLAVADAEEGDAEGEKRGWWHWGAVGENGRWATRQDYRFGGKVCKKGVGDFVERMDFAVDIQLSQPARDKLGDLAAEVDDEKAVMLGHGRWEYANRALRARGGRGVGAEFEYLGEKEAGCRYQTRRMSVLAGLRRIRGGIWRGAVA